MASPDPSRAAAGRPLTASLGELTGAEDLDTRERAMKEEPVSSPDPVVREWDSLPPER